MVRLLLRAYIKRFLSIFLSLIFIGSVSAGLFNAFLSAKDHLYNDPIRFFDAYGYVDEYISVPLDERSEFNRLYELDGVASIDMRLSIDAHLKKDDGRVINSRIFTYNDEEGEIMKRYVVESIPRDDSKYNVAVSGKFATNNNFHLGQDLTLSLYGFTQEVHIHQIVDTVEGIFPSFNPYVWSDDFDYGYLYFLEDDLNSVFKSLAPLIASLPDLQTRVVESTNLDSFDAESLSHDFASAITNELIIKNKPGYSEDDVLSQVERYLEEKGIKPLISMKGDDTPPRKYMQSVNKQLGVAFLFLPIFFYVIIMVLVGLFISQIIRQTTRNIGIMLANGASRIQIIRVLLAFTSLITVIASLFAIPIGYGISTMVTAAMVKTYCVPLIGNSLRVPIVLLSTGSLILVGILATALASIKIFSITPKDAALNNEAQRKSLPEKVEKTLAKMPFIPQNATNSMLQNKRRFFISAFTISASLLMILLCGSFYLSKTALIEQGCDGRMNYDCQVYLQEEAAPSLIETLRQEESISSILDCYYTYVEVSNDNGDAIFLECLAFDPSLNGGMILIPNDEGYGNIALPEEGIIIPKGYAKDLSVKRGDKVTINGNSIEVIGISYQYYHPITYLSKAQLEATGVDYYSSLLITTNEENRLSELLSQKTIGSLIVFTSSLKTDLHRIFDTLDLFLWIMIVFALAIALVILFIMNQNALAEQIHQFSLFRALGFKVSVISRIFLFQNLVQLILASIIAIPLNVLSSHILFSLASSSRQTYPFIFSFPLIGTALAFVIVTIAICHLLSLRKINKLELAENLRSNE